MLDPSLDVDFPQQLNDLEQLLIYQANKDNDARLTSASAGEHADFYGISWKLVDNRDELSRQERSRLATIIKRANSNVPGLSDATATHL